MYDIFDIMSFYAYDMDAVTDYVDTLQSKPRKQKRWRLLSESCR